MIVNIKSINMGEAVIVNLPIKTDKIVIANGKDGIEIFPVNENDYEELNEQVVGR